MPPSSKLRNKNRKVFESDIAVSPVSLFFSMQGTSNGAIGLFSRSSISAGNPPGSLPTTTPFTTYNNGGMQPYPVKGGGSLKRLLIGFNACAVAQGSVGANPTIRIDIYSHSSLSRTLVSSVDVPVPPANVNISNDINTNNFVVIEHEVDILMPVTDELIGVQFTNRNATNEEINGVARCEMKLEIEY